MARAIEFDLLTMGRSNVDLYSQDLGAPFEEITGFDASVGGSPTNIAIAASRLGLKTALLTAVGEDRTGDFVLGYLAREGVETAFSPRKPQGHTSLAILGIQPPDHFPLVFYRQNPADMYLNIDDVLAAPIPHSRAMLLSGTALSRGSAREATLKAAEIAVRHNIPVFLDIDLRPDQWDHPLTCGVVTRTLLPRVDVLIGTEEEYFAVLAPDPARVMQGKTLSAKDRTNLQGHLGMLFQENPGLAVAIVKRGKRGASIFKKGQGEVVVPAFRVEIVNTVGAGDAFAGGLVYGWCQGWDWERSVRMANACGAIVVTRHGCAAAMPRLAEALAFIESNGEVWNT